MEKRINEGRFLVFKILIATNGKRLCAGGDFEIQMFKISTKAE
jgi:hypothetical protein